MTPTTAVAVKLAVTDEPPEPTDLNGAVLAGDPAPGAAAGGIFGTLHRHIPILSRLSLNKTAGKTRCRSVTSGPYAVFFFHPRPVRTPSNDFCFCTRRFVREITKTIWRFGQLEIGFENNCCTCLRIRLNESYGLC